MGKNPRHHRSDVDSDPGFTVIGIPLNPKKGQEKKHVALSRAYTSRSAAETAKTFLEKAGCKDLWIREVGRPNN